MLESIFENDEIVVLAERLPSSILTITFNDAAPDQDYNTMGRTTYWGQAVFNKLGISAIGVVAKRPNWFPVQDMQAALPAILANAVGYETVFTFGGSMGAYAAIKFGRALKADFAIAFSPQNSINPSRVAKYDGRYMGFFENALHDQMEIAAEDAPPRPYIFYDPYHYADDTHVAEITAAVPDSILVRLPGVGHRSVRAFASSKAMHELVDACRRADLAGLYRLTAERKRVQPERASALLGQLAKRHPYWARDLALAKMAPGPSRSKLLQGIAIGFVAREDYDAAYEATLLCRTEGEPDSHELLFRLLDIELRRRNYAEAVLWGQRALMLRTDWPRTHALLATALMNLDRIDEAGQEISMALAAEPENRDFLARRAQIESRVPAGAPMRTDWQPAGSMIDTLRQALASSNASGSISNRENFRQLHAMSDVRWDVRDGGSVYVAEGIKLIANPLLEIVGPGSALILEQGSAFAHTQFRIEGRNCLIYIGKNCRFNKAIIKVTGENCCIIIGDETTIESGVILCSSQSMRVIIGDDCMLSNDVVLRTDDGHGIFDRDTKTLFNATQSVVLEPHVWIGNGARVNKGVRIGTGSVLGGASVASGDLEPNSVYAGVPARKVRENVVWSRSYAYEQIPDRYR